MMLSICIPVYRPDEKFVNKITSLSAQLAAHTEIVIYIDGYYSNYTNIQEGFGPIVFVFGSEKNGGVAVARNRLIHLAKGEYILWLDSDDNIDVSNLEHLNSLLGGFDVLYADRYLVGPDVRRYIKGFVHVDRRSEVLTKRSYLSYNINQDMGSTATCSKVIRKSVYDKVGLYDFRFRRSEDTEWFSRCLDYEELVFRRFDRPLVNQVYTNNRFKSNKKEWYYQVKMLVKNRGILETRDLIFAYHWLAFKYLRSIRSLLILSSLYFYRFYTKLILKVLNSKNHITYSS
jgi:glycosyltransferase involved in cell wall biosynthesis